MNNLDLNKKLQIFFCDFERKDIETLCNISLDSLPEMVENEIKIYPQDNFVFIEHIINSEYQNDNNDNKEIDYSNIVENIKIKKHIILTNHNALILYILCKVATGKIDTNNVVLYYRNKGFNEFKCYVKREEIGEKFGAYFVDDCGKKVDVLNSCEIDPNF